MNVCFYSVTCSFRNLNPNGIFKWNSIEHENSSHFKRWPSIRETRDVICSYRIRIQNKKIAKESYNYTQSIFHHEIYRNLAWTGSVETKHIIFLIPPTLRWVDLCEQSDIPSIFSHYPETLLLRHNGRDSITNHQPHIVYSAVYSGVNQRKHPGPRHWPLRGEFTGDRWIPHTNDQ